MPKEIMEYSEDEVIVLIGKIEKICTSLQNAKDSLTSVKEIASSLEGLNLSTDTVLSNIDKYLQEINSVVSDINNFIKEYESAEKKNLSVLIKLLNSGITLGTSFVVDAIYKFKEISLNMQKILNSDDEKIPIFPDCYQSDRDRFGKYRYGKNSLSTDGCGLFSCYYILKLLGNKEITPEFLTEKIYTGCRDSFGSDGSNFGALAQLLEVFGAKVVNRGYNVNKTKTADEMREALKNGCYVQVLVQQQISSGKCPFTSGGHFITLVKLNDNGKVLVYDSYGGNVYLDWNGQITDNRAKYEEGFDLEEEILPWTTTYLIVDSEFRDDGNDYTRLPEIYEDKLPTLNFEGYTTMLAGEGIRKKEWILTEEVKNDSRSDWKKYNRLNR